MIVDKFWVTFVTDIDSSVILKGLLLGNMNVGWTIKTTPIMTVSTRLDFSGVILSL